MKDIYSAEQSDYLAKTKTWHTEDSPWKGDQIVRMLRRNQLKPTSIAEIGCGAGEILHSIDSALQDPAITYAGYDIAKDAINLASTKNKDNFSFHNVDLIAAEHPDFDLLLIIDVFEHVPDYLSFVADCKALADYKIFHIPLDIHVSSVLRNQLLFARKSVGHIHHFTKETAIATLEDCGLEIVDHFYTPGYTLSSKLRTRLANLPRAALFKVAPSLAVKLLGGYSLLVLAK